MLDAATLVLFPLLMAFAATSDFLTMRISNRVSLLLVGSFLVLAYASGMAAGEVALHVAAGFAVLAVTFSLFSFGWIGGGDAKLAAATAVWLGFDKLFDYSLEASVFGLVLTLGLLQARRLVMPDFIATRDFARRLLDRGNGVPYGIALALAGIVTYPETALWRVVAGG